MLLGCLTQAYDNLYLFLFQKIYILLEHLTFIRSMDPFAELVKNYFVEEDKQQSWISEDENPLAALIRNYFSDWLIITSQMMIRTVGTAEMMRIQLRC